MIGCLFSILSAATSNTLLHVAGYQEPASLPAATQAGAQAALRDSGEAQQEGHIL